MIKIINTLLVFCLALTVATANSTTKEYLKENRQDLLENTELNGFESKLIGFGALHGSAKTEEAELILLKELADNQNLKFYFPETDFSTAYYFQKYIASGDKELLKDLIISYGKRVPQECSVEMFKKWESLHTLFKDKDVKIIGIDEIANYKFTVKHLLTLIDSTANLTYINSLKDAVKKDINWSAYFNSIGKRLIGEFLSDYKDKPNLYREHVNIKDAPVFIHITNNLKATFSTDREHRMFDNYLKLNKIYHFRDATQFFRLGIFHIMKSPMNSSPTLFSKFIKERVYSPSNIISIQGFLTKSKVLWNIKYDKFGLYNGYEVKKGFGISDYWLEYFKGIGKLKRARLSDLTLFNLNGEDSVYSSEVAQKDLILIKKLWGRSPWQPLKDKSTLDYIDYALLIRNSEASKPIQELPKY